jgi:hypothetical protein
VANQKEFFEKGFKSDKTFLLEHPPSLPLRTPSQSGDEKVRGDPANIFFTSKFSYLLFCNPTHKTQTGQQICGGLLTANHLEQLL